MVILHPIPLMAVRSRLIRCWPGDALGCGIDVTSAWLSVYNETVLPVVARVFSKIQRASIAPHYLRFVRVVLGWTSHVCLK
jgi:hypothetical protein